MATIESIKSILSTRNPTERHKYCTPEGVDEQLADQANSGAYHIAYILYQESSDEPWKSFHHHYFNKSLDEITKTEYEKLRWSKS